MPPPVAARFQSTIRSCVLSGVPIVPLRRACTFVIRMPPARSGSPANSIVPKPSVTSWALPVMPPVMRSVSFVLTTNRSVPPPTITMGVEISVVRAVAPSAAFTHVNVVPPIVVIDDEPLSGASVKPGAGASNVMPATHIVPSTRAREPAENTGRYCSVEKDGTLPPKSQFPAVDVFSSAPCAIHARSEVPPDPVTARIVTLEPRLARLADVYVPIGRSTPSTVSDFTIQVMGLADVMRASDPVIDSVANASVNGAAAPEPKEMAPEPERSTDLTPASAPASVEFTSRPPPDTVTAGTDANVAVPPSSSSPPVTVMLPVVRLSRSKNVCLYVDGAARRMSTLLFTAT